MHEEVKSIWVTFPLCQNTKHSILEKNNGVELIMKKKQIGEKVIEVYK